MTNTLDIIVMAIVNFLAGVIGIFSGDSSQMATLQDPTTYVKSSKLTEEPCTSITYENSTRTNPGNQIDIICETSGSRKLLETGYDKRDTQSGIIKANNSLYIKTVNTQVSNETVKGWNQYSEQITTIKPTGEKIVIFESPVIVDFNVIEGVNKVLVIFNAQKYNNRIAIVDDTSGEIVKEISSEYYANLDENTAGYSTKIVGKRGKKIFVTITNDSTNTPNKMQIDMDTYEITQAAK